MIEIETLINNIITTQKAAVFAIIVDAEGSAYRKEGAWMLFIEGDAPIGMISGGCLENVLHSRAERLFCTGQTEMISYDLSSEDELGWGRGEGCNGIVHVLLRDVDHNFHETFTSVHKTLSENEPVLYIQSMKDFSQYTFSSQHEDAFGFWDSGADWEWIRAIPFQNIVGQRNFGNQRYFIQLLWPRPNLYIIGAGMDARPLAKFANDVGFGVHVLDWREANCDASHFPEALSIRHGNALTLLNTIHFSPLDAVVVMTHDFQYDLELVRKLQSIPLLYFGILGSKKRTERLLGKTIPYDINSPVGLSIGADGPYEIAISIVAELIAKRRGVRL